MGHSEAILPMDSVKCLPAQGHDWDPLCGCLSPWFMLQEKCLFTAGSFLISNRM